MPKIRSRYTQDNPRYAQDMTTICPLYAQDMPKICPRYQDMHSKMSKICSRYLPDMPKICPWYVLRYVPRYVPDMSKIYPRYVPGMSQIFPRYVPDMSYLCPRYVQDMSKIFLLPQEMWDEMNIFKCQSNIIVSPALRTTNLPTKQQPEYSIPFLGRYTIALNCFISKWWLRIVQCSEQMGICWRDRKKESNGLLFTTYWNKYKTKYKEKKPLHWCIN